MECLSSFVGNPGKQALCLGRLRIAAALECKDAVSYPVPVMPAGAGGRLLRHRDGLFQELDIGGGDESVRVVYPLEVNNHSGNIYLR
jgi:hypothetical protein